MHPFEQYLHDNNLEVLTIAILARVRYLTVYQAAKGYPISLREAEKIRQVAYRLCGVAYEGDWRTLMSLVEQPCRKTAPCIASSAGGSFMREIGLV